MRVNRPVGYPLSALGWWRKGSIGRFLHDRLGWHCWELLWSDVEACGMGTMDECRLCPARRQQYLSMGF